MQPAAITLPLLLLLLLLTPPSPLLLISADLEEMEVITYSSPCSATCGLGLRTQKLCVLQDAETETENEYGETIAKECRMRQVSCQGLWHCGLRTVTVTTGERLEIDCLEEVMKAMGQFSWRVSWRFSRGIITSDDSLFSRWESAHLDRVVLDPVREENAGTYRCDVQDLAFRRVKRLYVGVHVLPQGVVDLDYDHALGQWAWSGPRYPGPAHHRVLLSVMVLALFAGLAIVGMATTGISWLVLQRKRRRKRMGGIEGEGPVEATVHPQTLTMEDVNEACPATKTL